MLRSKLLPLIVVTLVVVAFFGITTNGFLSASNLRSIMLSMCLAGMIGVGMSMLLISGEIDLASGYEACMGGILAALMIKAGVPWPVAVIITIIAGAVMGSILAFLVNKVGLMGFISSMAMISVYNGLDYIITKAQDVTISAEHASFYNLGAGTIGFLPIPFIIMIVLMIIYGLILYKTEFGRTIYMTGGNRAAARLAGVNRKKITTILYINNSAICALAGTCVAAPPHVPPAASTPSRRRSWVAWHSAAATGTWDACSSASRWSHSSTPA